MKKFLIIIVSLITIYLGIDYVYYYGSFTLSALRNNNEIKYFTKVHNGKILLNRGKGFEDFEIRGVNLGLGIPGHFATEYAINKETYMRWFKYIKDMGANTIRIYTVCHEEFYEAFYEFNHKNKDPLYLIHGVWINDYIQNSHRDALDEEFKDVFLEDCRNLVDVINGRKKIRNFSDIRKQVYSKDISDWVIGYIIGVEWEDAMVTYTDKRHKDKTHYKGEYMYTKNASPFETVLCEVGNSLIQYESEKYGKQRIMAFSNWPTTDPFDYSKSITRYFRKMAKVNVENIKTTSKFFAGQFASYHIYPCYPNYLGYEEPNKDFIDKHGKVNPYYAYLKRINEHHDMPVVISEFGVPSSRGMAQREYGLWRSQGKLSEKQQGRAIISCYEDIMDAGSSGSCIFSWQDEWFKRTWNTMAYTDLKNTPYWSDYQTNEQNFGLLAFDPGIDKSICYVDGDIEEWAEAKKIITNGDTSISMKYDEKFLYFLIEKENFSIKKEKIYIPIDSTPKTGSDYANELGIYMGRKSDFIILIDGKENSRVLVQERYDTNRALNLKLIEKINPYINAPSRDTTKFNPINLMLMLQGDKELIYKNQEYVGVDYYETGKLIYGNANPSSDEYNSLSDFCIKGDFIEIKIPWLLLNFANPSKMMIHDDYYENYGIEYISIDKLYVGASDNKNEVIKMNSFNLEPWYKRVTYHERLKDSYYILKDYWNKDMLKD